MPGIDERTQTAAEPGFTPRIGRSVSLDHAAELLRVSRRTVYNRIRQGVLDTITVNGSKRVTVFSLSEHLQYLHDEQQRRAQAEQDKREREQRQRRLATYA